MKGKERRKGGRQEERERKEERKAEKCAVPKYSNSNREQVPDSEQNSERLFCSSLLLAPTHHGGVQTTKKKIKKEGREEQFTPLPLLLLSLSTVSQQSGLCGDEGRRNHRYLHFSFPMPLSLQIIILQRANGWFLTLQIECEYAILQYPNSKSNS